MTKIKKSRIALIITAVIGIAACALLFYLLTENKELRCLPRDYYDGYIGESRLVVSRGKITSSGISVKHDGNFMKLDYKNAKLSIQKSPPSQFSASVLNSSSTNTVSPINGKQFTRFLRSLDDYIDDNTEKSFSDHYTVILHTAEIYFRRLDKASDTLLYSLADDAFTPAPAYGYSPKYGIATVGSYTGTFEGLNNAYLTTIIFTE